MAAKISRSVKTAYLGQIEKNGEIYETLWGKTLKIAPEEKRSYI